MRASQYLLTTLKETPADAEVKSHQLMLRAGMIRKVASGIYTWLPLGMRVLQKVCHIIREEMDKSGALECLMPSVQPAELWQESTRWQDYGPELLRFKDRHDREFCFGPTHEEVITAIMRQELKSYKQLPMNVYQIQTKFRDEIRPRFGLMRGREFIMKDAYSFHLTQDCLNEQYRVMFNTYCNILNRMGLAFRPVLADTGSIGGDVSHEFQVLAKTGEDVIAISTESEYAANVELAEGIPEIEKRPQAKQSLTTKNTPNTATIQAVSDYLNIPETQHLKAILVEGTENPVVAIFLRGDHELNEIKAQKHPLIASPLTFAKEDAIEKAVGCKPGFIGPIGMTIPIIADKSAAVLADFVCGANEKDKHHVGANWGRDCPEPQVADLRMVKAGDKSPDGIGKLNLIRGIEVGHIFQLGDKYSKAMNADVLNENGKTQTLLMGCYGMGASRIVAAAIEQNHDDNGMIWPDAIAPFQIAIVPINYHKSERVREASEKLYQTLCNKGLQVLFDDRNERPGVKFADMDLIGIPHRIVVGEKGLDHGTVELKARQADTAEVIALDDIIKRF